MDIKQDPNSIPNFNAGGRVGELDANEPEQAQSSTQLDPTADGDGAASGDIPVGSGEDSPLDNGSGASVERDAKRVPEDLPAHEPDESKIGKGAIDGLVGAP
jgi:hypothetical protein